MTDIYEADFSEWGYREISMATELLNKYLESDFKPLDGLKVGFNSSSAYVFLEDEDYNTFMMNGDKLEQFFSCPECGHEGFREDFKNQECEECKNIFNGDR